MPDPHGAVIRQQAIDADNLVPRRVAPRPVQQEQMVEFGIEAVFLKLCIVIDQIAVAAQFLDKNAVAQMLGGLELFRVAREPDREVGVGSWHTLGPSCWSWRRFTDCTGQAQSFQSGHS